MPDSSQSIYDLAKSFNQRQDNFAQQAASARAKAAEISRPFEQSAEKDLLEGIKERPEQQQRTHELTQQVQNIQPPDPHKDFSPIMGLISLVAAFSGGKGQQGAIQAMSNFASATEGYMAGDKERYARELEQFKINTEKAKDNLMLYQNELDRIAKDHQLDYTQKMEAGRLAALKYSNVAAAADLARGENDKAWNQLLKTSEAIAKIQSAAASLQLRAQHEAAYEQNIQYKQTHPASGKTQYLQTDAGIFERNQETGQLEPVINPATGEQLKKTGFGSTVQMTPEEIQALAKRYEATGELSAAGSRNLTGQRINKQIADDLNSGALSQQDFLKRKYVLASDKKALGDIRTKAANFRTQEGVMIRNFEIAEEYMNKVPNSEIPKLQKWFNEGRNDLLGDPDVRALKIALNAATQEYEKLVRGSIGVGGLTNQGAENAVSKFSDSMSRAQFKQAFDVAKREARNRVQVANLTEQGLLDEIASGRFENDATAPKAETEYEEYQRLKAKHAPTQ